MKNVNLKNSGTGRFKKFVNVERLFYFFVTKTKQTRKNVKKIKKCNNK